MRVSRYNEFFKVVRDDDAPRFASNNDGDDTGDITAPAAKHVSDLANLVCEASGGKLQRADVLYWLLHRRAGRSLAMHFKQQRDARNASAAAASEHKEQTTMTQAEKFAAIAKQYGVVAICKHVINKGPNGLSEHELVDLITAQAKRDNPTLTKEAGFSKMFCEQSPEGEALRKAVAVCKAAPFVSLEPTQVGGKDALDINNPVKAIDQLTEMAEKLRRQDPSLSFAQAFSRTYTDPAYRDLAELERRQSRPQTSTVHVTG